MTDKLLPCPFCGCEMSLRSNRDWHRIVGAHDEECVFMEEETVMVPASDEQKSIAVADWNRRAQPAAPADGEAVEVVGTAILGGLFHGGSGPELGDIDIETDMPALERIQYELVSSSEDVHLDLMTVAQCQRLMAAEIQKRFDGNEQSSREHREELAQRDAKLEWVLAMNKALDESNLRICEKLAGVVEALLKTAKWIEELPVPTVGAAGQLVKIDAALAAAGVGDE